MGKARRWAAAVWAVVLLGGLAYAHPLIENRWNTVLLSNRLDCEVILSLDEVSLGTGAVIEASTTVEAITLAADLYARSLTNSLEIFAGASRLAAEEMDFTVESGAGSEPARVVVNLTYPLSPTETEGPWRFRQDAGSAAGAPPDKAWDAACWLEVKDEEGRRLGVTMLPRGASWTLQSRAGNARTRESGADPEGGPAAWPSFVRLGVLHILGGWDHLLFLSAIALGARRIADFFQLALLFTFAHSITVTVSALGWLHPADRWVDPWIALTILFVAVENAAAPTRSASRARLAIVFGFGLIHGLGFAAGLREALDGTDAIPLPTAIAAFCGGVELGHMALGLPFWALIAWARRRWPEGAAKWLVTRGSWAVAAGGAWFLAAALRGLATR